MPLSGSSQRVSHLGLTHTAQHDVPPRSYYPEAMPNTPATLSPEAVLAWSDQQEVQKGRSYVPDLDELTAQPGAAGLTLTGSAYGQEAYRVQAVLSSNQVVRGQCSCPVGGGGRCKHMAAMLTRYSESPEGF